MSRQPTDFGDTPPTGQDTRSLALAMLEIENGVKIQIQDVATVGRAPDSDVVLEARSVTRHHSRIFYEGGHYWLKDLGSANGTTVNGKKTNLQMLRDGDRIAFGEVKAVFHFQGVAGPALLAKDPLEGSSPALEDGTPTGGLKGRALSAEQLRIRQLEKELEEARTLVSDKTREAENLKQQIEAVRRENERLRADLGQSPGLRTASQTSSILDASGTSGQENERLKQLVKQLERALADSNLRIRNLQERLDRGKD